MKVLLDECVPHGLRPKLVGYDVFTVTYLGWGGIRNGRLLALAAKNAFELLITVDASIPSQQNLATLPLAVVVIHAPKNDTRTIEPVVPELLRIISTLTPRTVTHLKV